MKILCSINTYGRYDTTFPMAWASLINQTRQPDKIIVHDENKEPLDPRNVPHLNYLMALAHHKGIEFYYEWSGKKGAHHNHERDNMLGFDAHWFIDDDQIAEPNCLEELEKEFTEGVGAVAGLILKPPVGPMPEDLDGTLNDVWKGQNLQWYRWGGPPRLVQHLYSSFLYRCGIVHHDLRLSKKAFRGETMFTHSLFLKGYKVIITPKAVTYHLESSTGGCRTPEEEATNAAMYASDHAIFMDWLKFQGVHKKLYVLNGGVGDHHMFLQAIRPPLDAMIACCYPDVLRAQGYNNLISIADAQKIVDIKDYDVYAWAKARHYKGHLIEAYKEMYANL